MGQPAARFSDMHVCPMVTGVVPHVGGPIMPPCQYNVLTGGMPQARVTDMLTCVGPPDMIAKGSSGVFVGGMPAARMGDMTAHGGVIVIGFPTVLIGETASGSTSGGTSIAPPMAEGASADHGATAGALIAAAKTGVPFCEQCAKAAAAARRN